MNMINEVMLLGTILVINDTDFFGLEGGTLKMQVNHSRRGFQGIWIGWQWAAALSASKVIVDICVLGWIIIIMFKVMSEDS